MELDSTIANFLMTYEFPALFLGAFFLGETVILTAAFLAANGFWTVGEVFVLAFLGTILSDALWFSLGQYFLRKIHKWEEFWKKNENILIKMDQIFGKNSFYILLYFKFLYGTRIITIIYLSVRKLGFWKFMLYDGLGTIIWLAVMIIGGWLAGKGYTQVSPYINRIEYGIIIVIILVAAYKLTTAWISKKITEK